MFFTKNPSIEELADLRFILSQMMGLGSGTVPYPRKCPNQNQWFRNYTQTLKYDMIYLHLIMVNVGTYHTFCVWESWNPKKSNQIDRWTCKNSNHSVLVKTWFIPFIANHLLLFVELVIFYFLPR